MTTKLTEKQEFEKIKKSANNQVKLAALLPKLKFEKNINTVKIFLADQEKTTEVYQTGNMLTTVNQESTDFKVDKFSFLVDDTDVIVTKAVGQGIQNIAHYSYATREKAESAAYKMALRQEKELNAQINAARASVQERFKVRKTVAQSVKASS